MASTQHAIGIVTRAAAAADDATRVAMREAFRLSAAHEHAFFAAPLSRSDLERPLRSARLVKHLL